jgi:hypothetical protein
MKEMASTTNRLTHTERVIKKASQKCWWVRFALSSFAIASSLVFSPSHAQDELFDYKPNLMWVSDSLNVPSFDQDASYDSSFLGSGEIWSKNWGLSTQFLENENQVFGLPEDSSIFNIDVKRRFAVRDNSQIEVGLGWQEFNIDSLLETKGARISLGGSMDFGSAFTVYGSTAWYPDIEEDFSKGESGSAVELEAGLLYQPFPSLSLKAGYRQFSLDSKSDSIDEIGSSSGFLLGSDLSW